MLIQEWNWDDAKRVWQKEAAAEATAQANAKWQTVIAEKNAIIAELRAQLGKEQ